MTHKSKVTTAPTYQNIHTLLLILMLHFRMSNVLNCTENSFMLIQCLLTYSQKCYMTTLLHLNFCSWCFLFKLNGLNRFTWFKWAE